MKYANARLFLISPYVFSLSLLGLFAMLLSTFLTFYFLSSQFPGDFGMCLQSYWPVFAFVGCIWAGYLIACYIDAFQFFGLVLIHQTGLSFYAPFHKAYTIQYNEINDIGIDCGLVSVHYQFWIYFSKDKFPKQYLHRINRLPMSQNTMRVQFSRKLFDTLLTALPPHLSKQLKKGESVLRIYQYTE